MAAVRSRDFHMPPCIVGGAGGVFAIIMADPAGLTRICAAIATGNIKAIEVLVGDGIDLNEISSEGFAPLCIASFWGYADIVKLLLEHGADVNVANQGTGWTPCHCAASQGHGKILLHLMRHNPDLSVKDSAGRLANDFASAMDSVWPFFAAQGCRRTSKAELIQMDVVKKVESVHQEMGVAGASQKKISNAAAHFSRPGSAYVVNTQALQPDRNMSQNSIAALAYGDVLRDEVPSSHTKRFLSNVPESEEESWRT